jgi:hypothetical protein
MMSKKDGASTEIGAAIFQLSNNSTDAVDFNDFLVEMKTFIIDHSNGNSITDYRSNWERGFKQVMKSLNHKCERVCKDNWPTVINEALKSKKASNSSSFSGSSNRALTEDQLRSILKNMMKSQTTRSGFFSQVRW